MQQQSLEQEMKNAEEGDTAKLQATADANAGLMNVITESLEKFAAAKEEMNAQPDEAEEPILSDEKAAAGEAPNPVVTRFDTAESNQKRRGRTL